METWLPEDWTPEPEFISQLRKPALKGLARRINRLWKDLSRKIKDEVKENPSLYSIIYVPNGFIVPGGKGAFKNDVRQGQGSEGARGMTVTRPDSNRLLSTQDLMKICKRYIVGGRGVVQLGGLVPGYPWEVPLRLRLVSLFIEGSLKAENK